MGLAAQWPWTASKSETGHLPGSGGVSLHEMADLPVEVYAPRLQVHWHVWRRGHPLLESLLEKASGLHRHV